MTTDTFEIVNDLIGLFLVIGRALLVLLFLFLNSFHHLVMKLLLSSFVMKIEILVHILMLQEHKLFLSDLVQVLILSRLLTLLLSLLPLLLVNLLLLLIVQLHLQVFLLVELLWRDKSQAEVDRAHNRVQLFILIILTDREVIVKVGFLLLEEFVFVQVFNREMLLLLSNRRLIFVIFIVRFIKEGP